MSATDTRSADLALRVCADLGVEVVDAVGPGGAPVARPRSEEELLSIIAGVTRAAGNDLRSRPRLAPLGFGSSVTWCRASQSAGGTGTVFLSTRSIVEANDATGIVEYVPGDGTLTALAGASMADLRAAVAEGGHRITPAIATTSTLGGTLAAGRSGPDRCAFGPLRHHVLGTRVADGTGRVARSGGRLVKNVTGFDLHRLHVGARGTLGVILEASLRLMPVPEAESYVVSRPFASDAEAVDAALGIRADRRVAPRMLFVRDRCVHVLVAGRAAQVDVELAAVKGLCDIHETSDGDGVETRALGAAERSPALRILTVPSRVADVVRALVRTLGTIDGVVVEPDAAIVDVPSSLVDVPNSLAGQRTADWVETLFPALDALGAQVERRGRRAAELEAAIAGRQALPTTEALWTRRLVDAFDPAHLFRIDGFPAGM